MAGLPTVKLKIERLKAEAKARGWSTDRELAQALGISAANVSRIYNTDETRRQGPGVVFIAAALIAMPDLEFADLFDVVEAQQRVAS